MFDSSPPVAQSVTVDMIAGCMTSDFQTVQRLPCWMLSLPRSAKSLPIQFRLSPARMFFPAKMKTVRT